MSSAECLPESPRTARSRYSATRTRLLEARAKPVSHEMLREHAFFKDRDPELVNILLDSIRVQIFLPGSNIATEGDEGDCMYFMYRGEVEILVGPDEKRVAVLKDGSLFGEMALLGDGRRKATIRAITVCDCRVIKAANFHICLKRFPQERKYFDQLAKQRQIEINETKDVQSDKGRLEELDKCEDGANAVPKPPAAPSPGGALKKFRRASKLAIVCGKLNSSSAPTSRTSTCTDDLAIPEDQSSSRAPSAPPVLISLRQFCSSRRRSTSNDSSDQHSNKEHSSSRASSRGRRASDIEPNGSNQENGRVLSPYNSPAVGRSPLASFNSPGFARPPSRPPSRRRRRSLADVTGDASNVANRWQGTTATNESLCLPLLSPAKLSVARSLWVHPLEDAPVSPAKGGG